MPVVFDNVIGTVVADAVPSPDSDRSPPPIAKTIPLASQLRKLTQRVQRLKAD